MQLEIQVALNFIISYLYNKLPRRRVNIFGEELERLLKRKYEGHWYPDKPYKGSGYRCIHVGEKVEPIIEQAANESGLDIEDVRRNLPHDLNVWIDPSEVSYQIGEKGQIKVLYVDEEGGGSELDKEIKNSFNPEAQAFLPISADHASPISSSPSPPFGDSASSVSPSFLPRSSQPLTFTTAAFAATKFGSTKMKNAAAAARGKMARSSPTQFTFGNLVKQSGPSASAHSLYGLGLTNLQQKTSALSPDAKEFLFPDISPDNVHNAFPYGSAFDVFTAYGGLNDKSLVDGLNFNLGNSQYSNQQFQPVMAN